MIILACAIAVLFLIALPLCAATWLRRRAWSSWLVFLVGVATFAGSQAVHLPLNHRLTDLGLLPAGSAMESMPLWRTALLLGLTAGLCEELARTLGFAFWRRHPRANEAIMAGLGHGGIEAMVIGAVSLAATIGSLLALRDVDLGTLGLSQKATEQIANQIDFFEQPYANLGLALVERILAMTLHVTFSVIVWQAFSDGQASLLRRVGWVAMAIAYHTIVDAVAVSAGQLLAKGWQVELALLAITVPGAAWLWRRRRALLPDLPRRQAPSLRSQMPGFGTSLRKELLQLARRKHLIIALALFLFVGISSPLLAYLTPAIFRSIEEVKPFAELIPEPSTADSLVQYIKNLTQFLLPGVILLGMGAVAGEKERGTAAMALSKPIPRWGFVLAKMTAQALLHTVGLSAGALFAFGYTWVLFEPLPLGPFAFVNLLLWAWLMVYVAVTLLGSTLAATTGAAAGLAVALSGLLLLAGQIPTVGQLAPGGLIAWASAIGPGFQGLAPLADGIPYTNAGALAMAGVLTALALVAAVGAFEAQEL